MALREQKLRINEIIDTDLLCNLYRKLIDDKTFKLWVLWGTFLERRLMFDALSVSRDQINFVSANDRPKVLALKNCTIPDHVLVTHSVSESMHETINLAIINRMKVMSPESWQDHISAFGHSKVELEVWEHEEDFVIIHHNDKSETS
jgi:hypothetical protein